MPTLNAMDQGKRSERVELLAVLFFGLLLKIFAGRNSLTEHGVVLPGYDEYYHMRRILYGVNNFPDVLWFDSYLNYPHGLSITWPPLFDQISAALCLALGQHTKTGVEMTAAFVPVIIGLLAMVVVYYIMRELFDHRVALLASFMAALAPYYLLYTMVAATDHHSLEVFLQLVSLLFYHPRHQPAGEKMVIRLCSRFGTGSPGLYLAGCRCLLRSLSAYCSSCD